LWIGVFSNAFELGFMQLSQLSYWFLETSVFILLLGVHGSSIGLSSTLMSFEDHDMTTQGRFSFANSKMKKIDGILWIWCCSIGQAWSLGGSW